MSYVPVWRATTRALAELGCAAFFIGGVAWTSLGAVGPWAVLAVVLFSVLIRAADIEARALFIPGGLPGSVRETLGQRLAIVSASALLVDRLMLGAIAAVVAGHYLVAFGQAVVGVTTPALVGDSGPMTIALLLIGIVWWLLREGRAVREDAVARAVAASVGVLVLLVLIGTVSALLSPVGSIPLHAPPVEVLSVATALGLVLSALGSVESLTQAAVDLEQPRIRNLQRVARLVSGYGILFTAGLAFLFVAVVAEGRVWSTAPLAGIAYQLAAPLWLRLVLVSLVVGAAAAFLTATLRSTSRGAHGVLARLADDGVLDDGWRALHHRFGTPWRSIDTVFIAQVAIVMISGGETSWLARAYAIAAVIAALLKLVALVRYRSMRAGTRAYRVPLNLKVGGREWPLGLIGAAALLAIAAGALVAAADPPSLAGLLCVAAVTAALLVSERSVAGQPVGPRAVVEDFQLLPADVVDLRQVDVRPGNFLVPVRRPHILAHLVGAIRDAGDRDVVAMTVRLVGMDVPDDPIAGPACDGGRAGAVVGRDRAAEREGRAVRLMIVPGVNVFDSVVETALRLESAEIHVGESETLSADDQARLLGDAWERASKPSAVDVRLVVHHPRGSTAAYHLGAHAPALRPEDFEHIHRLWLDVVRAVGPSVHHHDVVRAALNHMEQRTERSQTARPRSQAGARHGAARPTSSPRSSASAISPGCATCCATGRRATSRPCSPNLSLDERVAGLPHPAAQDRRRNVRISSIRKSRTRCCRAMASEDVGGAAQQHGAGRSHDVPRGAARRSDAAAARRCSRRRSAPTPFSCSDIPKDRSGV